MQQMTYIGNNKERFFIVDSHKAMYSHPIECGHCTSKVTPILLVQRLDQHNVPTNREIMICPSCQKAISRLGPDAYFPSPKFGASIEGLPAEIETAFEDARSCMSVNALIAAELLARTLLMHVAVEKGDTPGKSFVAYIDYLEANNFITITMKPWVDEIRKIGNNATHRISAADRQRTELTMTFLEMLLRNIYEMPHKLTKYQSTP
jgi:hypothetical protein